MRTLHIVAVSTALLFAGCKQVDGTYYPGCVALEGDKIVDHPDGGGTHGRTQALSRKPAQGVVATQRAAETNDQRCCRLAHVD